MTNQARRNRKGAGGMFASRRSRVKKGKYRISSRDLMRGREAGSYLPRKR